MTDEPYTMGSVPKRTAKPLTPEMLSAADRLVVGQCVGDGLEG